MHTTPLTEYAARVSEYVVGYIEIQQNTKRNTPITPYPSFLLRGKKDARIPTVERLIDICAAFHVVIPEDPFWGVPECEGNPMRLNCPTCKGFKGYGIC